MTQGAAFNSTKADLHQPGVVIVWIDGPKCCSRYQNRRDVTARGGHNSLTKIKRRSVMKRESSRDLKSVPHCYGQFW
jgi:hypothetical protein